MITEPTRKRLPLHLQILMAMIIGSVIGIVVNPGDVEVSDDIIAVVAIDGDAVVLTETTAGEDAQTVYSKRFSSRKSFADVFPGLAARLPSSGELKVDVSETRARLVSEMSGIRIGWQRSHEGTPAVSELRFSKSAQLPAFWQAFIEQHPPGLSGTIITAAKCVGDLFLQLLKMVTVPLILTSLITGVTGLGGQGGFGRMFSRTLIYYLATSMLAITTGVVLVNLIGPGVGTSLPGGGEAMKTSEQSLGEIIYEQIGRLIPANPFTAIAEGEFLSIISFAILTGMFINLVGGVHGRRLKELVESSFEVMMKMTAWIISLAPLGVAAFMIYATGTQGISIFQTLAKYMLTVFLALLVHAAVILPVIVRLFGKRNPWRFAQDMSPALLTAFSTASSNATLPLTMTCVEERAGISNRTSSFVLPLGATINMDGTALYEVVAVLFIAQATPGIDLSFAQQITVALTALIASVGAAGIPHAGLVMMAIVLQAVGLPLEAQGIIIAVDRVLDMCRTSVNVWSDACGCAVVETLTRSGSDVAEQASE
ncbi:MAG: dicarboxylate/amino acid:cation symporter [Planctomycetaceae bacterium]